MYAKFYLKTKLKKIQQTMMDGLHFIMHHGMTNLKYARSCLRKNLTKSYNKWWLDTIAKCRGVHLLLSVEFFPLSFRVQFLHTSECLLHEAQWSSVHPIVLITFFSAWFSIKILHTLEWPFLEAQWSGENPQFSIRFFQLALQVKSYLLLNIPF